MNYRLSLITIAVGAALAVAQHAIETKLATLTPEQRERVRKFQLDDQRYDSAIKQRQLEIIQLQQQSQQNTQQFKDYIAGLCKEPAGYQFDLSSDDLKCVAKPVAPTPTPKAEKK